MNPRDARLSVRFSEEEIEAAKQLAEKHGLSYSDYVRRAVLGEMVTPSEQKEMLEEISRTVKEIAAKLDKK